MAEKRILVNSISPGYIDTPILSRIDPELKKKVIDLHPMKRLGTLEEIAKVVVFLLSDDASFITVVNIAVDCGYIAL